MFGPTDAAIFLIKSLGNFYLLLVIMRFLLQMVRADFYNPISQFVVRATQPVLRPLRRFIPGYRGIDFSSLILAILLQMLLMAIIVLLFGAFVDPIRLLIWSIISVTSLIMDVFFFALLASVVFSWIAPGSSNPLVQIVAEITTPLLAPIQRFLPSLGGLDISPIFAFLAIQLFNMLVLGNLAQMTSMPTGLSIAF